MDTEKKDVEEEPFSEELDLPGATIGVPVQPQATSALLIADDKSIRSASSMMRSLKLDGETMDAASRDRLCVTFGSAVNVVLVDRESSRPLLVTGRLPLQVESTGDESATSRFSQALADGVLMAHLAEALYPGSVPASLLDARLQSKIADTQNKNKRMFIVGSRLEQLFKVLAAAPFRISLAARTKVQDVVDGCGTSVLLELVWSLLAEHVIAHVDIDLHPQLVWLRDEGESLKPVLCARPEQLLVRWFNYHLKRAGSVRTIHDLCDDLTDSGVYAIVMSQLVPERCLQQQLRAIFDLSLTDDDVDLLQVKIKRAELVLENSRTLGCPYDISAEDMASGQPHVHLLMATFLFNSFLGIRDLPEEDEVKWLESELDALTLVAKEYDEFRTNAAASEATWKQNAMQEQYELRKQTLATELSLCNRIDDLEQSLANEAADHHAEYDTLACSFERYRHRMQSRLGRTLKYLNAYMERRVEIFADANLYTISAFNTEGKRIAWNIPAPALTRNCSFEYVPDEESSDDESTAVTTPVGEGEASAMPANAKSGFQRPPTPPLDTVRSSRRKRRQLHAHVALSSLAQLPSTSSANSDYAQPSAFFKSLGEHARPATPNGGGYRLPTGNQSPNHSGSSSPPASPLERATFLKLHRMDSDVSTTFNCISRPRLNSAPPDVLLQRISSATVKQLLLTNQSADDADTGMPSSVTTVKTKSCASLAIEKRPVSGLAELEKFTVTPPTAPLSNETASSDSEDDARYQRLLTATPESDGNQPDQIFGMVQWLVDQNLQQLQQIQLLAAKVDEMSYLNKTMGEKVRQFSEELINQKPKRGATFRISSKFSKR